MAALPPPLDAKASAEQHPRCGETRVHDRLTLVCSRPEHGDGGHVDHRRRACWTGDDPATDLHGRPLLKGTVTRPVSDPRAFRRRRSAATRPSEEGAT